jgi:tetratricopeptide (TPR) repeat protein
MDFSMLNSNGSAYDMKQATMDAMNFVLEEQDSLNRNMKPVFNKYIDQAVDLQKNDSCQRSLSKSEEKFKKALAITKKNKYARSSVLSNLSQLYCSHYQILPGGIVHNLKKSIQYLEEVLKINERKTFGHKYAHTLTKLGNVYRRCAMEPLWLEDSESCLKKAKKYHDRALNHSEKNSPYLIHLITASEIYFNLSSVFFDMDDTGSGCEFLEKSFVYFLKALDINDEVLKLLSFDVVQHLSVCFSRLDYFGAGKYQRICGEILNVADEFGIERGRLIGTHPIGDITNPEMLIEYKYKQAKKTLDTTELKKHVFNLLESRRSSSTDQEADRQAFLAQLTVSKLARLLCDIDEPTSAFERLEYCSGLRYAEYSFLNWYMPKNKYDYLVLKITMRIGALYYEFGQIGFIYDALVGEGKSEYLKQLIEGYKRINVKYEEPAIKKIINYSNKVDVINEKVNVSNFHSIASEHAKIILSDFMKLDAYLNQPSISMKSDKDRFSSISAEDFQVVLERYPDLVLVKLDIQKNCNELLVIIAYYDKGLAWSESVTIDMPEDTINTINEYVYENLNDSFVKWDLGFIDWLTILPKGYKKVALLPSFFASNIPWLSSGVPGKLLINLVDEVVYLPGILHLRHKNIVDCLRDGEIYVNGGNTQFQANLDLEVDASFTSQDKDELLTSLKDKSIFSYYGHCAHQDGGRAALKFENFDLYDLELQPVIKGMERIEFWSCQSGKNLPSHIMGSPVNEPFGMDMEMLKQGVETSIGSLWSVPELSTLHIKQKYDEYIAVGMKASKALLSAQRWWLYEGADQEVEKCKVLGIDSYLRKYKCNNLDDKSILSFLGPIKKKDIDAADLNLLAFKFKHPISWAGFRFCGLPEHKSERLPENMTEFTDDEITEVKKVLAKLDLRSGYL